MAHKVGGFTLRGAAIALRGAHVAHKVGALPLKGAAVAVKGGQVSVSLSSPK